MSASRVAAAASTSSGLMPKPSLRSRKVAARRSARPERSALSVKARTSRVQPSSKHARGIEKQQPVAARVVRRGAQAGAGIGRACDECAAGGVGDLFGVVLGAAVGDDDLAHDAGGRARHQSGQRRHQYALRITGRDENAQQIVIPFAPDAPLAVVNSLTRTPHI